MHVNYIELADFRNYAGASCGFAPGANVLIGQNGQGKTNLLEAVYFLAAGKSFRTRTERELIRFDAPCARIYGLFFSEGRDQKIEARITQGQKKALLLNGARVKRAAELGGRLAAVLFSSEDLGLIRDTAAVRRRFLDLAISQLRPKYAAALADHQRLYTQKVRILKDFREKPSLLSTLDDFNIQLARAGAALIYYRAAYMNKLERYARDIHAEFSGERLSLQYRTVKTISDPTARPAELFERLMEHQSTHRQAEIDAGLCLSGAHKDDFLILINEISAKAYASQGQIRTAALSIKLAERDILRDDRGEHPLLLLDDVLSELDAERQSFILNRIQDGQVFITCCEDGRIAERTGGHVLRVEKGAVY